MNHSKITAPEMNRSCRDQLLTLGDLETFKNELFLVLKTLIREEVSPKLPKKWLKSQEVKKILNISTGTLQNLRNSGSLPYSKIGGLIYYDRETIDKLMASQENIFADLRPSEKRYF